ncbi:MAG: YkuS family protein [Firmicutes bacterium]|nr:YkuS family protein [Bacillota bacterium]
MKIAIQTGLGELSEILKAKGFEVVPFRQGGNDVKITILNDIDEVYEEIDPVTFMGEEGEEMVLLDAGKLSQAEIIAYVEKYMQ